MHNRTAISLIICLFALIASPSGYASGQVSPSSERIPRTPAFQAKAAALIDATSGQVLFELDGHAKNFPASTTKVLTALVAAERGDSDSVVTVGENAFGAEGTSCYLQLKERQPLLDLIACMLVASGNDAAIAIAEHVAGSVAAFATLMTDRATAAGAQASQFRNPHGLHESGHYTTAVDLALIARAALSNPQVRQLAALERFPLVEPQGKVRQFINHNDLMDGYPGSIAGKTGFTEEAGHTLVHAARQGDLALVAVILDTPNRLTLFREMSALLDYGFAAFQRTDMIAGGQVMAQIPVKDGAMNLLSVIPQSPVTVIAPRSGTTARELIVEKRMELAPAATAPVLPGQVLGRVVLQQAGREIGSVNLVAREAVAASVPARVTGWFENAGPVAIRLVWRIIIWSVSVLAGLLLLALAVRFVVRRRRRALRRAMYRDYSTRVWR